MEKKNPLVSVIVPIYMVDQFLGHCIESIMEQSYKELEIILVDDGSRDRCPEMCDMYAQKDERIKVIHKKNGGLVSARKAGLEASSGQYVTYIDGDDWIGIGHIGSLVETAIIMDADMVCAGFTRNFFSQSFYVQNGLDQGLYEGRKLEELWRSMISYGDFYCPGITTYVWNKLFRREILIDAQMSVDERISVGEDGAVTYPALLKCKRVAVTGHVTYHYRQREDSMLKQNIKCEEEEERIGALRDYMIRWSETTPEDLGIRKQTIDYLLSIAIIRFGGWRKHGHFQDRRKIPG